VLATASYAVGRFDRHTNDKFRVITLRLSLAVDQELVLGSGTGSPTSAFAASMLVGVAAQDLLIAVSLRIINTTPFLSDFIPFLGW
jgi:hypothetical protein